MNPVILQWARERTGRTTQEVAQKLGKAALDIERWETGLAAPTYPELERLAYDVLKRPIAIFFFPSPPAEPTPEESFRTLPGFEIANLAPATRHCIRRAYADQLALKEFYGGKNPASPPLISSVSRTAGSDAVNLAARVREELRLPVKVQTEVWQNQEQAVQAWRDALEVSGVFVYKDAIKQSSVSGFCLYDPEFPLIVVNNSTSLTKQVFTLIHELGHLLARTSGVAKRSDEYLRALKGESREIEVFCNAFAAEVLIPLQDFRRRSQGLSTDDTTIELLARTYKVSREVVLRRFLTLGRVTKAQYDLKAREWASDYDRGSKERSGGDFYRTHATYLSQTFLREVFRQYLRGGLEASEAAEFLGVKPAHLAGLEEIVLQKASI